MRERLKSFEKLRAAKNAMTRPRSKLAILLLAGTAIAGCGGNSISASDREFGKCGSNPYSKAGFSPFVTKPEALTTATHNVRTLQLRALSNGGDIDIPDTPQSTDVEASPNSLTLNFFRGEGDKIDQVTFPIKGNVPKVSIGAVMCFDTNTTYTVNGTFTSLEQYVEDTAHMDEQVARYRDAFQQ